jgi:putative spermidine/putrescine transport system ATP-binding protein
MSTAIRLVGCSRTYPGGVRALEPVDLSIAAGETLVLLGPSGCGKTTLLRLIAGLDLPEAGGRVWFGEEDVTELPIEKRNVGMVFQSYALFPNMSVSGNVAYGLRIRGIAPEARTARVRDTLRMMRIEELADRRIDQLSGGQRQRVALARAIAPQPRVLLLDEPLTALDAKLRDSLRTELDALLRSLGITTVYVTHDQAEAMSLGDRIAVMDRGHLAQIGSPLQIYREPSTTFVADFVGTMNRVDVRLDGDHLIFPGGRIPWVGGPPLDTVMFRPEDLQLAPPGEGNIAGVVQAVFFLGDHSRVLVETGADSPLIVKTLDRGPILRGQAIGIHLDRSNILPLPGRPTQSHPGGS